VSVVIASQVVIPSSSREWNTNSKKLSTQTTPNETHLLSTHFGQTNPFSTTFTRHSNAIPNECNAANIRLDLHEAQAIKLAQILSEILDSKIPFHPLYPLQTPCNRLGNTMRQRINFRGAG
jgi:hypothetical protein